MVVIFFNVPGSPQQVSHALLMEEMAREYAWPLKTCLMASFSAVSPSSVEVSCMLIQDISSGETPASVTAAAVHFKAPSPPGLGAVM